MAASAEISYSMLFDPRTKKFVPRRSKDQPMVLCQVQHFDPEQIFTPRKVNVGKFLADTGPQVNVGTYTLLDLMGISRGDVLKYTWDTSEMKINGIGGNVDGGIRGVYTK